MYRKQSPYFDVLLADFIGGSEHPGALNGAAKRLN